MQKLKKTLAILTIFTIFITFSNQSVIAQSITPSADPSPSGAITPTPDSSSAAGALQQKIAELEGKVKDLQSQEKSLSSQISLMDNQIQLTQYRISATQEQITEVTNDIQSASGRIQNLEGSVTDLTKVLINRIVATYQAGAAQPMQALLTSNDATDLLSRANYLRIVQDHDKQLLYDTEQAKLDYANQKNILEDKKKKVVALQAQLQGYTTQLDQEKTDKQTLLTQTQGSEENYSNLLAEARAQLAGFSRFTASQGGSSLLSSQTVCDDWGCYYNQRDSSWGGMALNNTQYSIASDGCLMTSMAMVYTHLGHKNVTPVTINSNSDNFASYEPAWLKKTITADGATSNRVSASIDSELSAGNPVIVGISYDGGPYPDHFVVLISGSNGDYIMNDPYTPNGHKIAFTSHYSVGSIREIDKVVMQ